VLRRRSACAASHTFLAAEAVAATKQPSAAVEKAGFFLMQSYMHS